MSWQEVTDLTLLYPDATKQEFEDLYIVAKKYKVASICVPPTFDALFNSVDEYSTTTVVNFPMLWSGFWIEEDFKYATDHHVKEIDVGIPVSLIKNKEWLLMEEKLRLMRNWSKGRVLKGIIETGYLNTEEIKKITSMLNAANFDYVKTGTGYGPRGVTLEDVHLIKGTCPDIRIKASGNIKTIEFAELLIKAGADRLGIGFRSFIDMVR